MIIGLMLVLFIWEHSQKQYCSMVNKGDLKHNSMTPAPRDKGEI